MTAPISVFDLMGRENPNAATQAAQPQNYEQQPLSVFDLMGDRSRLNADTDAIGKQYAQALDEQALKYPKEATQQLFPMVQKYRADMDNHFARLGYSDEQRGQILASFDANSAFLNPTDGTLASYVTDPVKTLGKGFMNLAGSVTGAFTPDAEITKAFKDAAKAYDLSHSADSQVKALKVDQAINDDIANGSNEAWATFKHLVTNPSQIGNLALENLPQMMFAPAGAAAMGGVGAAQVVGNYRDAVMNAWRELTPEQAMAKPEIQGRIAKGMPLEQAIEDVSTDISDHLGGIARSAAIGSLESLSPLVKVGKVAGAVNRGAAKTFAKEVGKEFAQEGLEQASENYGVGYIDGKTQLMDGVQRAAVTGALASAPFGGVAGYDAYRNDQAAQAQSSQSEQSADEQEIQQAGGGESNDEQVTEVMSPMTERQFAQPQPQQAVQNPQQNANSAFDETAFNKAIESVAEDDRDIFKARLERDIANDNLANRTGNGKYDRFVRDYLALNQVPEVVRQAEQQTEQGEVTPEIQQPNTAIQGGQAQIQLGSQGSQTAQYELVEADELAVNLKPNAYQNRDRTSADSQAQIMEYAANLNPNYLGASVDITQGAPTVDGNYGVFAGNGRLAAIKQAYAKNPQNATAYRDYLAQNAPQFGFTAEQVQGMKQPVLVRKVAGNIDLKKAVEEGNFNTGLDKGVIGNAKANADYISDELLDLVEINDDGSLNLSESNTPFISSLVSRIPVEQRPQFFAEKKLGNQTAYTLTAQGRELVENALLVKAYSDGSSYAENLLTDLITGTEDGNKRVKAALTAIAGKVIQTKGTEYDISADLVQAYDLMSKGKKAGLNAVEAANQGDLLNPPNETVQGLVGLFYSPKSISEVQQPLNAYLDKVIGSKLHQTEQSGMFDDENPSRKELLNQAGMKASRSAMKSVEANIKRGKQAMNTAITERRTVHRAMFNHELGGWVDFEWGDDGLTKPFNKKGEPVGKGIAHIIEARQRKDGMSYQDVVRMLMNNVVETIAKGEVVHQKRNDKFKEDRITIDFDKYRVALLKRDGGNAWIITGFEKFADGERSVGNDTTTPTHPETTLTRQGVGASATGTVRPTTQDVNSSPEIQQAKAILEKALGKAYAEQVNFVRSSDFNDGRATAEGFFQNGKVHIVLDNIYSNDTMNRAERMAWVAWHEFAHNGVDVRFKGNYDAMIEMARSHPVVNVITRRIKAEYETAVANGELDKMPNENTLVEEALVELYAATKTGNWAEIESRYNTKVHRSWKASDSSLMALFERIANAMRRMVGRIIGKDLRQTTNDEIFAILKGIDQGVQSLAKNSENQTASGDTRYSLNERADSAFAKAVDDVANGNRTAQPIIDVGTTPDVLKMLGLPDVNVVISGAVLHKVMHGKHNVTPETLKQLPKQINNPVAVMKSETQANSYVVLTELTERENGKDKPVIAALHLKRSSQGFELINIASVYGRSNAQIQRGLENDLLYWNKEKGAKFLDNLTLQLRSPLSSNSSIGGDIKTEADLSQYQAENSGTRYSRKPQELSESAYDQAKANGKTELTFQQWKQVRSPEFKRWFGDWENDPENASKVINPRTGEPLVVYHGTNAEFSIFKTEGNKTSTNDVLDAAFFTSDVEYAQDYLFEKGDGKIISSYIVLRNPLENTPTSSQFSDPTYESKIIRQAREKGNDGILFMDKDLGLKFYAVFKPNQIKSATDNNGEFSAENEDIRYSRKQSAMDIANAKKVRNHDDTFWKHLRKGDWAALKKDLGGFSAKLDEWITDSNRPVIDWVMSMKSVSPIIKQKIIGRMQRATAMRDATVSDLESRYLKPIQQDLAKLANEYFDGDVETTMNKVGFWISARWAVEKNAQLLAREEQAMNEAEQAYNDAIANKEPSNVLDRLERAFIKAENQYYNRKADVESRDFSNDRKYKVGVAGGWSSPLAQEIMRVMEKQIPRSELEAVAEKVYDLNQAQLEYNLKSGRYTQAEYDFYIQDRHYVPLTGTPHKPDGMENDTEVDFFTMPGGKSVNTAKDKSLKGRILSEADNAITAVWESVAKTATYTGWADFKHSLNDVFEDQVQAALAKGMSQQEALAEATRLTGITKQKMQGTTRTSDNVLVRKENGQYYEYRIPDEAINALKKSNEEYSNWLIDLVAIPTRWYARGVTQFTGTFAFTNMIRDTWEKSEFIRVQEMYDKNGNPLSAKQKDAIGRALIANTVKFGSIWKATKRYGFGQKLQSSDVDQRYLQELIEQGGLSTHSTYLAKRETDLIKQIEHENRPLAKRMKQAVEAIEGWNAMFDTVSSLSAYKALREAGIDKEQAASITLELTNFRKTGSKLKAVKGLWMFAQPTAMGGRNLAKYLSTKHGQKRFAAYLTLGVVLYSALRGLADDDEGGNKIDQLGDIDRYIPIPSPFEDGKFIKIPVGFGMPQMAWSFATNMVKAGNSDITITEAATNMFMHTVKATVPVSPSEISAAKYPLEKAAMTATPSIFQPLMQIALNRNAFGSQITTGFVSDKKLKAEQAKANTAPFWKETALWLSDMRIADMHPEQLKALWDGYSGMLGSLREVMTVMVENPNRERLGKNQRVPLLNTFYGAGNEFAISSRFYEAVNEARDLHNHYTSRKERGTLPPDWLTPERKAIIQWMERTDKETQEIRSRKAKATKAYNAGKMGEVAYQNEVNKYDKMMDTVQRRNLHKWRRMQGLNTSESLN